jgi:hypothetical protein
VDPVSILRVSHTTYTGTGIDEVHTVGTDRHRSKWQTAAAAAAAAVTGFMLANHASMAELFDHLLYQYDRIRSRNAFLDSSWTSIAPVNARIIFILDVLQRTAIIELAQLRWHNS